MNTSFDYIIVGAGSAGCVLAERLSADGRSSVLLLEAGGSNRSPWVTMPKGVARLVGNPAHTWLYEVAERRQAGSPAEVWIRGRGLGGSSAINGMIWSRGEAADYDAWEALGCAGWNGRSMLQAFRALEDHALGASDTRGSGGPVRISPGTFSYPLAERMIEAGEQLGLRRTEDLNAITGDRVGYYSHNIHRGRRQSGAVAFLDPARSRPNLEVMTGAVAERVDVSDRRATGVAARVAGKPVHFACSSEVIVCAGTLESPRLLQLSGIGDTTRLRAAGIEPVHHSPDVGERMREHLSFAMPHRLREPGGINRSFFGLGLLHSVLQYYLRRSGPMATGPFEVGGFLNVAHPDGRPDAQLYLGGYTFALSEDNHPVPLDRIDPRPGITIYGQLLRLSSEGTVRVRSADPAQPAEIRPNWLATDEDRVAAVALVRAMRRFMAQPALAPLIAGEMLPGEQCRSDEEILAAFRKLSTSGLHGTGTCRMGGDPHAVLDARLRVRGIDGLRVADCSVMPAPVTGNTNAPAMALGWRAAGLILEDRSASHQHAAAAASA